MNLPGKHALVTGASKGIGAAITSELIAEKCRVTGLSRTRPDVEHDSGQFDFQAIDFSKLGQLPDQLKQIHRQVGTPDILVCNAGYGRFGSLEEFSSAQIREMIDVNLTSQILVVREFLPAMKAAGNGHLIFIGSEAALSGGQQGSIYCASKFALRGFSQSIRKECSGNGVAVTLVNPGMVQTGFFDKLNFVPGSDSDCHLQASDVSKTVIHILNSRPGCCPEEINIAAQKKVFVKKPSTGK